jgi:hypothetical protein
VLTAASAEAAASLLDGHAGELASGGEALSWFAVTTRVPSGLHPEGSQIFLGYFRRLRGLQRKAADWARRCPRPVARSQALRSTRDPKLRDHPVDGPLGEIALAIGSQLVEQVDQVACTDLPSTSSPLSGNTWCLSLVSSFFQSSSRSRCLAIQSGGERAHGDTSSRRMLHRPFRRGDARHDFIVRRLCQRILSYLVADGRVAALVVDATLGRSLLITLEARRASKVRTRSHSTQLPRAVSSPHQRNAACSSLPPPSLPFPLGIPRNRAYGTDTIVHRHVVRALPTCCNYNL